MNYVENQLDGVHGLFDHWQERFSELFARFDRQAQAVLPDVVERQNQLGDKLSQLNAGFGAREARLTKWLMEIEQQCRQLLEELKAQQEQVAQLQSTLREQTGSTPEAVEAAERQAMEAVSPEPSTPTAAARY
jgi:hypothetical protein